MLLIARDVPHQPRNLTSASPARPLVARNAAAEQESVALIAKRES